MIQIMKKTVLAVAVLGVIGTAQAAVVGNQSYTETGGLRVTKTTATTPVTAAYVDGQLGSIPVATTHFALSSYQDSTGVYKWSGREIVANGDAPGPEIPAANHSGLGVWSFAQVGSQDVWFGEWDAESTTAAIGTKVAGTHTVWYNGENGDVATTLPTAAPVSYTVRSINNYSGSTLPTSTLTANFATGAASSTGDIGFTSGTISTVGSDVQLAANNVSVASASGTGGTLDGKFYGTGASAVAGIVTFSDRTKDTAFGGSKNP
ncbi:hypothetical protein IBT47_09880 [Erwinia sp. S43]|uniref:Slam-dependent surface lipoprotein n=1 Tax=Erwinia sp. S43 TaxID=2769339 RepID=UPI0019091198|nr:Slam-dependent surface lipoprotein [Erwinia sp. S43]MBK0032593.1 hypothetical protein [Erwinia sp. S43]